MSEDLDRWWLLAGGDRRSLAEIQTRMRDGERLSHDEQRGVARSLGLILDRIVAARVEAGGAVALIEAVPATPAPASAGLDRVVERAPLVEPPRLIDPAAATRCSLCGARSTASPCPACASSQDSRRRATDRRRRT